MPHVLRAEPRRAIALTSLSILLLLMACGCGAAQTGADQKVSFAVFGDNRGGRDGLQPALFPRLVAQMAQLDIDFVLGTGDYIHGSSSQDTLRRQWNEFFIAMEPLQSRKRIYFVPAPGNHDIRGRAGRELFMDYFHRTYFSFDWGGSHFIVLDTEVPGQESRIAGKQLEWLKTDLANAADAWHIFVALHRPFWPVGPHKADSLDMVPSERDALHYLFAQQRVTCVFQGHEHLYNRRQRDGVEYIITGGGGAPLYAPPDKGGFHHFLSAKADRLGYKIDIVRVQ